MKAVIIIVALPALFLPLGCLLYIFMQGWSALSWDLLWHGSGSGVGMAMQAIWPQILGSLLMMLLACMMAAPIALALALFSALWASGKQTYGLMVFLQILQGIPPIVYGLCGLVVMVHLLHWGISLMAGGVILAVVILPLLSSNMIHALERIPTEQSEAAQALGLRVEGLVWRVWMPQAWKGMLTGLLLGMARSLSETAPILFTATVFSGVMWPSSIFSPVTSLQTHIFYLAQEGSNAYAVDVAWASAVVLLGLILLFSLTANWLRRIEVKA